jgi:hypothetical protein
MRAVWRATAMSASLGVSVSTWSVAELASDVKRFEAMAPAFP